MTERSIVGSPISLMLIGSDSFYAGGSRFGYKARIEVDQGAVGYRSLPQCSPQLMCVKARRRQAG